jgi:hypothetical protein
MYRLPKTQPLGLCTLQLKYTALKMQPVHTLAKPEAVFAQTIEQKEQLVPKPSVSFFLSAAPWTRPCVRQHRLVVPAAATLRTASLPP